LDWRDLCPRADRDHDLATADLVGMAVVGDRDPTPADDLAGPAVAHGSGRLECLDVARIVRLIGVRRTVDHVVATLRSSLPGVRIGVRGMARRGIEERLRRHTADVWTAPAKPLAVDDGDARAALAGLVRGRLAGGPGTD